MFSPKGKKRWLAMMAIRRGVSVIRPDTPYLKIMPPTFRLLLSERFRKMEKDSFVGTYDQTAKEISLITSERHVRRHEVAHAIRHYASLYPNCSRFLPLTTRLSAWLYNRRSRHLKALGFIMDESIAQWIDGNKLFMLTPSDHYLAKAFYFSPIVGTIWNFLPLLFGIFVASWVGYMVVIIARILRQN